MKEVLKNISLKDLIYLAVIVLLILFSFKKCNEFNDQKDLNAYNLKVHESDLRTYIDKYNREVATKGILVANSTKELKKAIKKNDSLYSLVKKFKKVNTVVEVKTITKIVKDTIKVKDSILVDNNYSYIFENHTKNYSLYATLDKDNLVIDTIKIPNIQFAVLGDYKPSFFRRSLLTTKVTNSNPFVKTTDLSTLQIEVPKKWYEKGFVTIPLGIVGGVLLWETIR